MTDLTRCANFGCPIRRDCWRFMAPIEGGRSDSYRFADFAPSEDGECIHRIPMAMYASKHHLTLREANAVAKRAPARDTSGVPE